MRIVLLGAALMLVAGCNNEPAERTVFDEQLKAKDKARAVEGQLREAAEQRNQPDPSGY